MNNENAGSRRQISSLLYLGGIVSIIFGVIHFFTYLSTGASISLWDALFNSGYGILTLLSAWLISKGNKNAILILVIAICASIIYTFAIGRRPNFIFWLVEVGFLVWILALWRRGNLA